MSLRSSTPYIARWPALAIVASSLVGIFARDPSRSALRRAPAGPALLSPPPPPRRPRSRSSATSSCAVQPSFFFALIGLSSSGKGDAGNGLDPREVLVDPD